MDTTATVAAQPTISIDNLAPDTGKPLTKAQVTRFGLGFLLFGLTWMTAGAIGAGVLLPNRFTYLNIGKPETILSMMNSISIIFALIANVVFGALSDITRSRFGKRTPWIFCGGFVAAAAFYCTSIATSVAGIVVGWSFFQIGINIMIAPCIAILSDRVPSKIRGTMSAFYGAGSTVGGSIGTIAGSAFINNDRLGFILGVVLLCISGILTVFLFPKELPSTTADTQHISVKEIVMQFRPPTKGARDFYLALVGRMLLMVGYYMIMGYQLYVAMNYIGLESTDAAALVSQMSLISTVIVLPISLLAGPISDKMGKRKPPVVIASIILCIGLAIPFASPTKMGMLVFAGVASLGYGVYTAVDQALNVDVLPNAEEAGKDLGILNLANTLGQILAPLCTSTIVIATNSYKLAFPAAIIAVLLGAVSIIFIKKVK
ncbi:MFS transporter [Bifidobacterium sp. LC6]|uniref:MFS transporter n=1 Tax=Bifidobacterium colobi TaxID=2809026 RepID=A0ABS5UVE1_9BIFI|nr:MFS transporter [Bifidobacterium colobi]MBT1175032.1 MFS transporter [Bifidobacterium colobi]